MNDTSNEGYKPPIDKFHPLAPFTSTEPVRTIDKPLPIAKAPPAEGPSVTHKKPIKPFRSTKRG